MANKICCGFGHRLVLENITETLTSELENLIINEQITVFYCAESGDFDSIFCGVVQKLKTKYPYIKAVLIKPYFSNTLNTHKEYYSQFDDVIIPDDISDVHYKSAITARNKWMIDKSDVIVSYIRHNNGGAYTALKYARKKQKACICL